MKKGLIIGGSILGVILICLLVFLLLPFKINLNGESIIKLNYQDEYKEPGAYLTKLGIRFNKEIKIDSNVNINTLGEYIVTYKYKDIEKTRKVIVTDLKKPDIEITKGDITIFVNEEYIEYGATANDNVDGDLTKSITIDTSKLDVTKEGNYDIVYSVCDKANNCDKANRKVNVKKGDIIYGTFKQKTDLQSSILTLSGSDKTFTMDINLCEGFATIKGSYSVSKNTITLTFKAKQYKGYASQKDTKYKFSIENNDNVKFQSSDVLCGPFNADIYERVK